MSKTFRYILTATAAFIALFLLAAVVLYIPPIQNYVVRKVTDYVSKTTDMTLRVERVRLAFPLNLALINVFAMQKGDTIVETRSIYADIALLPLLKKRVDVKGFCLRYCKFDTSSLISNTQVKGSVERLTIGSRGIDLKHVEARVNDITLTGADINVFLCDTAAADTSSERSTWRIKVDETDISNSRVKIKMPGDSIRVAATLGKLNMSDGEFDLSLGSYGAKELTLRNCAASYDIPRAAREKGFDVNHISVSDLNAGFENAFYRDGGISANVVSLSMSEKCGLRIDSLSGKLHADTTKLSLTGFKLRTLHSKFDVTATVNYAALKTGGKGNIMLQADGKIDRRDLENALPKDISGEVKKFMPETPLILSAKADGTNGEITVRQVKLHAKNVLTFAAGGTLRNITETDRRGQLKYSLAIHDAGFIKDFTGNSVSIPRGTSARGNVSFVKNEYFSNSVLAVSHGTMTVSGKYNAVAETYTAKFHSRQFPLGKIIAGSNLRDITAQLDVNGRGFDPFSSSMRLESQVKVKEFGVDKYDLSNIKLQALLRHGTGSVVFDTDNDFLAGSGRIAANFNKKGVKGTARAVLKKFDLGKVTGRSDTLLLSTKLFSDIHADNTFSVYGVSALIDSIRITAKKGTYPAKDLHVMFENKCDSLLASLAAGDLNMRLSARGNLDKVISTANGFATLLEKQITARMLDQNELRQHLPDLCLYINAGKDNPVSNIFKYSSGYKFDNFMIDIDTSPEQGMNGHGHIYSFDTGALLLDTIGIKIFQDSAGVKMKGLVRNTTKKNPYIFRTDIDGYLYNDGAGVELVYKDKNGAEGMNLGVQANLVDSGMSVHIYPENPVIAFRKFKVNKDNFITLSEYKTLFAKVDLLADDGTGLKVYTTENDSINDLTLTVNRLNLKELTSAIPYAPDLSGFLSGDLHLLKQNADLTAAYAIKIDDSGYENTPLGNLGLEGTYIPDPQSGLHNINAFITREDAEVVGIDGSYFEKEDSLAASLSLLDFPVDMLNGFMGDMLGLKGNLNGILNLSGSTAKPILDGMVKLDSIHVYSDIYGFDFNVQNDSARINKSNLQMENLRFYSTGTNPLVINGGVDFSNTDNITLNVMVNAKNFELVDAGRTKKSQIYGKVFSDINANVRGTLDDLRIRGNLDILSNTNVSYVLQDSPLSVDNRLNELVTFVDFSDTTTTSASQLESGGVEMSLGINISDAARLHCDISDDKQSYVDIEGGGNLSFRYTKQGEIILTGRYTATSGEMKYALPVIPLRTFYLTNGSYIEFTGDPANPTLNIQAKERIKATVTENNISRSVAFDAGISITQPLSRMGLEFTLEAPEDQTVRNQLAAMSAEQRNKLAISMLATGMYLEESNTSSGFKANNALNAFLQSEVQQIAGSALKTIDLSVSVEDGTSETGEANTDYSFRFAKRFWGNRVNVIIGGRVSTGEDARNDAASFIDNVSLEYRLDNSASRYIRLFYDHNTQDALEGQLTEMGAGVVLRRKTSTFGEIFRLWKSKKQKNAPAESPALPASATQSSVTATENNEKPTEK